MRRLEKMILSLICGAAIGLPGCYASDDRDGPLDPPPDAAEDAVEDMDEEEEPADDYMYGPPIITLYGPPAP